MSSPSQPIMLVTMMRSESLHPKFDVSCDRVWAPSVDVTNTESTSPRRSVGQNTGPSRRVSVETSVSWDQTSASSLKPSWVSVALILRLSVRFVRLGCWKALRAAMVLKSAAFNKQLLSYGTCVITLWTGPVCVMSAMSCGVLFVFVSSFRFWLQVVRLPPPQICSSRV